MSGSDTIGAVQRYLDAFNSGNAAGMEACFASNGAILDGMAPHLWTGPTAASDWYRDVLIEGEHLGAGNYHVVAGEPEHNAVTGNAAYIAVPATMTFDFRGQRITQTGAKFTFALTREAGEWRIAAWAWAKGKAG
jgi:hypothetical protein